MATKTRILILSGILICSLITSCNNPLFADKEETEAVATLDDVSILGTTVAQTLSAVEYQLQSQENQEPTATPLSTATPTESEESTETYAQNYNYSYSAVSCYAASTVSETIYDNTVMDPSEEFTKTWTLLNSGSCSWYSGYQLVYKSGYQMSGDSPQYISSEISPGESVTFSVDMVAPSSEGTYTGKWELQTSDGTAIAYVWVKIIVDEDDDDFSVTSVTFSSDETYTGTCPYTFTYKAYITTNDEGDVIYYFKYSDGSKGSSTTLEFDDDDTQTVSGSWTLSSSGSYWVKVYIKEPNNQTFGTVDLTLTCSEPTKTPTTVVVPTTVPTTVPTAVPTATEEETSGEGEETTEG